MRERKSQSLLSGLLLLTSTVATQSADEVIGSNLTIEESLVQFVNGVTTFQVEGAEQVLLYVVMPLLGFYYLILNFVSMAYENFQERVDRPAWRNTDEDIPTGMKGFAMITSVITVLFLGAAGAGLLLVAGLTSFALGLLMFLDLFDRENQDQNNQPQQPQQQQQTQQQQHQQNQGGGWANAFNAAAGLFGTAQNTAENLQQQAQQQDMNQLQNSLSNFNSDFISELEQAHSDLSDTENLLQDAEDAISNDEKAYDRFRKIVDRADTIKQELEGLITAASNDGGPGATPGSVTYSGSDLESSFNSWYSTSNKRGPLFEAAKLQKQLERTVQDVPQSSMEDDFDKAWTKLRDNVFASAYFVHNMPYDMDTVIAQEDKRKEIIQVADSMGKHSSRGDIATDASELKSALSYIRGDISRFNDIIKQAEQLAQGELKLDESEVNELGNLAKNNKQIHSHLEFLLKLLTEPGSTPAPSNFSPSSNAIYNPSTVDAGIVNDLDGAYGKIEDLQSEINSIEASIQSAGEHETDFYKELEELKSKIN